MKIGDRLKRHGWHWSAQRGLQHVAHADRAQRRSAAVAQRQVPPQPPGAQRLFSRRAALHRVHRVKVRVRRIGRPGRVNGRQHAGIPDGFERCERRVQAEEAVEIDRSLVIGARAGLLNRQGRTGAVVIAVAKRHQCVQPVHAAALKDTHQHIAARGLAGGRKREPRHPGGQAHAKRTCGEAAAGKRAAGFE